MSGISARAVGSGPRSAARTPLARAEFIARLLVVWSTVSLSLAAVVGALPAAADSFQTSNDNSSTGWYSNQPLLTPSAVGGGTFGSLFNATLSGKIYAQPLVSQGNVLAVTENDYAYGVDTSTGVVSWTNNYGPAATPTVDVNGQNNACGDIGSSLGITGTPVIDQATNTAYFVAARATGPTRAATGTPTTQYYLEAANVATGAAPSGWPVGGVPISGTASNDSGTSFVSDYQTQRPGLVLVNGVVYAAFGAQCDFLPPSGTYTGWLIGISTSTHAVTTRWASEIGGRNGGGIWQSGGAPVVDANGNIFLITGNSFSSNGLPPVGSTGFNNPQSDYGEAVVELSTSTGTLQPVDFFIPSGAPQLNTYDLDFSSGGPVELPASMGTPQQPNVLLGVGKNAILYSMDMSNLGGYEHSANGGDAVSSELALSGGVWGRPAVWPGDGGYVYLPTTGSSGGLSSGTFNAYQRVVSASGAVGFQLAGTAGANTFGYTSGAPVVTSDAMTSGSSLVWIIHTSDQNGAGGQLVAYNPIPQNPGSRGTLTKMWSSPTFTAEKYSAPGVGNGALYVGTQDGHLLGFGFGSAAPVLTGNNVDFSPGIVSQRSTLDAQFTAVTNTTLTSFASSGSAYSIGSPSITLPANLTAGQSISVPVTFTPTVIGVNAGSLTANTTTGPTLGTTMVTLSGSGVGATSKIVSSPTSVNFGLQPISGLPVNQTVTMTNSSGSSINIVGFTSPLTSTPFSITGAPANGTLANNASVTFTVTFTTPGSSGNFSHVFGSVATLDTSVGNFGVPLSGSASPLALLALVPTSLNFNNVQLGQSTKLTFNVEDNGGLPLTITSSTPPSGGVGIVATTTLAANTVIQGNSSVQETVIFTPTTAGPVSDGWVIVSNDGNGPATLDISGTGIINKPGAPAIGSASAGNASAIVSWTAPADNGGAPVSHYTVTAADTTMSANGGQTCATSSSDSCTVSGLTNGDSYSFRVVATNSVGDGVASNVTNFVVPLPPFSLAFSPTSLDFGNVQVGENSSLSFTIDNTGGVPLTLIASTPPRANGFSATSGLSTPLVIAAHSSERESVDFTPLSRGAASASWLITGDKGTGQHSFTMSGRGIVNLPSAPTNVSASADYSSAQVAWHAPSSNGGDVITTYTVSAHDVTSSVRGGQKCTTTATTCEVSGLTNGDRYTLSVVATNVTGSGPSSNSSAAVVPALATLRIVTRSGRAGSPQLMRTRGDTNGGALTYYTVDGTARGCRIFNDTLNATRGGSCVVVAVRSARGDIPLVSSPATRVMMAGKVASSQALILTVNFTSASSTLSSRDDALLLALAKSLKRGVTVTVTGYSENNPSLAKARARSVTTYLHRVADVRVTTLSATTPAVNAARISWLDS